MQEINLNGQSQDIVKENVAKLKQLFPEIVTEDNIDFDKLKAVLGEYIEKDDESYRFTWYGKRDAFRKSQIPSTATLRPCIEESKDWDTTQNLYIEGDNLEVLKLLQKSYDNRVKMIYIDPPYNKDKDFIYPDKWSDPIKEYKRITGQIDEEGNVTSSDSEDEGGRHTKWLNMMYPRLKLAYKLLKDEGVCFIHIDDVELNNLKKLCDEVFGEENFINIISVKTKVAGVSGSYLGKSLQSSVEYILIYSKDINSFLINNAPVKKLELYDYIKTMESSNKSWKYTSVLTEIDEGTYVKSINAGNGDEIRIFRHDKYNISSINQVADNEFNGDVKKAYYKYIDTVFRTTNAQSSIRTRVMEETQDISSNVISIEYIPQKGKNSGELTKLYYKDDVRNLIAWLKDVVQKDKDTLYKLDNKGNLWDDINYNNLTREGDILFANGKKPIQLLIDLINMFEDKDSIIMDFFGGSSSTAHACMALNALDKGNRKFIMVQLPEDMDKLLLRESSSSVKKDLKESIDFLDSIEKPHSLAELGKERIRRAGESIKAELKAKYDAYKQRQQSILEDEEQAPTNPDDIDIGFKVFKLDNSNLKKWSVDVGEDFYKESKEAQNAILSEMLGLEVDNFVESRSELDVVYEIMLKYGLDLTYPIETYDIDGTNIYSIGYGGLIVCLDANIKAEFADKIVELIKELEPSMVRVAVRDLSFKSDSAKTNFKETLKNGVYAYFESSEDKADKQNQFKFITI